MSGNTNSSEYDSSSRAIMISIIVVCNRGSLVGYTIFEIVAVR